MNDSSNDVDIYYGVASGQQRAALRRLEPEHLMISHATNSNTRINGDYDLFVDCGGYHHMANGSGEYETSAEDYLDYIEQIEPEYFALRDYPCEPDLLDELGRSVRDHQSKTTDAHVDLLNRYQSRDIEAEPVAVVQGWTLADYERHHQQLQDQDVISDFHDGNPTYLAIGSICRRGYDSEIATIILRIRELMDRCDHLHAFGVKKNVLRFREVCEALTSADSAAYDWEQSRQPSERESALSDSDSFTWRDSARAYLNWRYDLLSNMATETLTDSRVAQSQLDNF